jgi:hypothetical protein
VRRAIEYCSTAEARFENEKSREPLCCKRQLVRGSCHRERCLRLDGIKFVGCRVHFPFWAFRTTRSWSFAITCFLCFMSSRPHLHRLVSHRNLTQLGGTIRQVLASNSNGETIQVHGWVKSIRVQKRIAFAMINDGTTQKGLQAVFRNPADANVSVCSLCCARMPTYFLP